MDWSKHAFAVIVSVALASAYAVQPTTRETEPAAPETGSAGRTIAMQITRNGSQPSTKGSAEYFTGIVRIDAPFQASDPARVGGATVTFEPAARTAWHTHPLGQTLIVTAGTGWVQVEGGPVEQVQAGDIVWLPPNTRHWHGATPTTAMTHIAIGEKHDGKSVEWMEKVTDEQYRRRESQDPRRRGDRANES